ncbi:unnamed protein product [Meganyctiphanes norvegica]|uniref:G protein pathway suppressor 2 n=1 Tax=Meganyctiphanes norvegica TaxID=48144 RepID=A0AAV2PNK4_MEGNR
MVKFAEAEKRRGEGGDRRYAPFPMLERPKTSRAMWESLKEHILKDRKRKKEELEADAEEKRIQKEMENRKKQHVMSLEETREKISQKEQELLELKSQKHQLFQELKVVLNEDATRKRQQQQQNYIKESEIMAASIHSYPTHGPIPIGSHPQMLFQSGLMAGRSGVHTLIKAGAGVPPPPLNAPVQQMIAEQSRLVHSGMKKTQLYEAHHKRPRSPVTPPPAAYQMALPYGMKSLPVSAHAVLSHPVAVSTTSSGSGNVSSVYVTSVGGYYHGGGSSSGSYKSSNSGATRGSPSLYLGNPPPQAQPPPQHRPDDKHLGPVYMAPHSTRPSGHVSMHSVDHKGKSSSSGFPPGSEPPPDKYFSGGVPQRQHLTLHPGVLPVQQPQPGGGKSGSITSGFPVRGGHPLTTQSSAPPVSSTTTNSYSGQVAYTRSYY